MVARGPAAPCGGDGKKKKRKAVSPPPARRRRLPVGAPLSPLAPPCRRAPRAPGGAGTELGGRHGAARRGTERPPGAAPFARPSAPPRRGGSGARRGGRTHLRGRGLGGGLGNGAEPLAGSRFASRGRPVCGEMPRAPAAARPPRSGAGGGAGSGGGASPAPDGWRRCGGPPTSPPVPSHPIPSNSIPSRPLLSRPVPSRPLLSVPSRPVGAAQAAALPSSYPRCHPPLGFLCLLPSSLSRAEPRGRASRSRAPRCPRTPVPAASAPQLPMGRGGTVKKCLSQSLGWVTARCFVGFPARVCVPIKRCLLFRFGFIPTQEL